VLISVHAVYLHLVHQQVVVVIVHHQVVHKDHQHHQVVVVMVVLMVMLIMVGLPMPLICNMLPLLICVVCLRHLIITTQLVAHSHLPIEYVSLPICIISQCPFINRTNSPAPIVATHYRYLCMRYIARSQRRQCRQRFTKYHLVLS
jgi:hypothetical protein